MHTYCIYNRSLPVVCKTQGEEQVSREQQETGSRASVPAKYLPAGSTFPSLNRLFGLSLSTCAMVVTCCSFQFKAANLVPRVTT